MISKYKITLSKYKKNTFNVHMYTFNVQKVYFLHTKIYFQSKKNYFRSKKRYFQKHKSILSKYNKYTRILSKCQNKLSNCKSILFKYKSMSSKDKVTFGTFEVPGTRFLETAPSNRNKTYNPLEPIKHQNLRNLMLATFLNPEQCLGSGIRVPRISSGNRLPEPGAFLEPPQLARRSAFKK